MGLIFQIYLDLLLKNIVDLFKTLFAASRDLPVEQIKDTEDGLVSQQKLRGYKGLHP